MKRRQFLATIAGSLAAGVASGNQALFRPASRPVPGIIDIGATKQTFLDDFLIFEASKIDTFMTRPQKFAENPILVADREWEQSTSATFPGAAPRAVASPVADSAQGPRTTDSDFLFKHHNVHGAPERRRGGLQPDPARRRQLGYLSPLE